MGGGTLCIALPRGVCGVLTSFVSRHSVDMINLRLGDYSNLYKLLIRISFVVPGAA